MTSKISVDELNDDLNENNLEDNNSQNGTTSNSEIIDYVTSQQLIDSLPQYVDVVIVGASCSGLILACELALRKINFVILDDDVTSLPRSRSVILNSRSIEILTSIGISENILLDANIVRGIQVIVNEKNLLNSKFLPSKTRFPFFLVLDQYHVKRLLIEHLEQLGHIVYRPISVWNVELLNRYYSHTQTGIEYKTTDSIQSFTGSHLLHINSNKFPPVKSPIPWSNEATPNKGQNATQYSTKEFQGQTEDCNCIVHYKVLNTFNKSLDESSDDFSDKCCNIRCKYVAGCDGYQSIVRKCAEIHYIQSTQSVEFLIADISITWRTDISPDQFYLLENSHGNMLMLPLPNDEWRMICMRYSSENLKEISYSVTPLPTPDYSELQQIIVTMIPNAILETIYWTESFRVFDSEAEIFCKSSVIIAGKAAHIHPCIINDAMNSEIQDAHNLGWKLACVLDGGSLYLLNSYSDERKEASRVLTKPSLSRWALTSVPTVAWTLSLFSNLFLNDVTDIDLVYNVSQIISTNNLSNSSIKPGERFPDFSVIMISLFTVESHTLLLCMHVLPPGTRIRSLFGCEKDEEAVRWSGECFDRSTRLARRLYEIFKNSNGRKNSQFRVIWILCGLVNFKSPYNNVSFEQIKDHIPHRLKQKLYMSKVASISYIAVDYENEIHNRLGLRLADPDSKLGNEKSAVFLLIRPDRYVCMNGYLGDSKAASKAFDYALNILSE